MTWVKALVLVMLTVSLLYSMILDMVAREGEMLQMSLHNFILDHFKESEEPILIFLKIYSRRSPLTGSSSNTRLQNRIARVSVKP